MREIPVALAAGFIGYFLVLAIMRLQYPFELEWMEGAMVDHVGRLVNGETIYCKPSLDFVALRYTPLFYYLGALLSPLLGVGLFPLRLISIVSALGCFSLIYMIVKRETGRWRPALVAAGFFAASFPVTGAFMDIARVDSLSLCLILAGIALFQSMNTRMGYIFVGLVFGFAFLAKQSALPVAVAVILCGFTKGWRPVVWSSSALILTILGSTIALDIINSGWYTYYVFELGGKISTRGNHLIYFWDLLTRQLFAFFSIAMLMSLMYLVLRLYESWRTKALFMLMMSGSMVGVTHLARIHPGGWTNTFMPAVAAFAILFGLAYQVGIDSANVGRHGKAIRAYTLVLVMLQFAFLVYGPRRHLPTAADKAAGEHLMSLIESYEGEVFVPYHGHYASSVGNPIRLHFQATREWAGDRGAGLRRDLEDEVRGAIQRREFAAIILDRDWYIDDIESHYDLADSVFDQSGVFLPVAGWRVRPERIYVPKQELPDQ